MAGYQNTRAPGQPDYQAPLAPFSATSPATPTAPITVQRHHVVGILLANFALTALAVFIGAFFALYAHEAMISIAIQQGTDDAKKHTDQQIREIRNMFGH